MGLVTGALIGGGLLANYLGARTKAKAAEKAAGQQVASAEQAKSELRPIYQGNVDRMQPYADMGLSALGQTRALMGYPAAPPPNANAVGRDAQGNPLGPVTANQPPMNMSDPRVQQLANGGSLADLGNSSAPMGGGGGSSYGGVSAGTSRVNGPGGGSFSGASGRMAKLQSPDGEVRDVPVEQAEQFIQAGARRVG